MLDISYEIRKGILFIRLDGILTKITFKKLKKEITDMIEDNGISNVVFNIERLSSIDDFGINCLKENIKICKNNDGKALLCGLNNDIKNLILKSNIFDQTTFIDSELNAFQEIIV